MNCKVCGNTSAKNPNVSFFRFPSEPARCRNWAIRCNMLEAYERSSSLQFYKSYRICSDHFDPKNIVFDGRKKKLLYCAIPEIFNKKSENIESDGENDCDAAFKLKLIENLCRLCAEENRNLTDIFGWRGKKLDLENKLKHLPVTICENDVLPLRLCNPCIVKINQYHEFIINCIKSENKLKIMLDLEGCDTTYKKIEEHLTVENPEKDLSETVYLFSENETINYEMFLEEIHLNDLSNQDDMFNNENDGSLCNSTEPSDNSEKIPSTSVNMEKLNAVKEINFNGHVSLEHDYSNMLLKQDTNHESKFSVDRSIEKSKYTCYQCLKSFSTEEILNSHAKAHLLKPDEDGNFICKSCNKIFRNRYRLNEHNRIHTGENPYKCDFCSKTFYKVALLKQHLLIHNPDKPYSCSICNVRSSRRGNLLQHMKSHYKTPKGPNLNKKCKAFVCRNCFYVFPNFEDLKSHQQVNHSEENIRPQPQNLFMCDLCPQNFSNAEEYRNHLDNHSFVSFTCGICQKQYSGIDSIKHHFRNHNNDVKYTCRYCDKNFKSKEVCVTHERAHTGEAPFECGDCGKTFRSRQSFHQHKKIHSSKRLFSCGECDMSFKRKDTLKNHFRIHTGERPYACTICGFAFKQRGDCIKHQKNHKKKKDEPEDKEKDKEEKILESESNLCSETLENSEDVREHLVENHNQPESLWADGDNVITLQQYSNIMEENLTVDNLSEGADNCSAILALAL